VGIVKKDVYYEDISVGSAIPSLVKAPVDKVQLVKYAGASGDFNPLHTDPEFGKAAGVGQIAHGMLVMGFVGQAVTDWLPKKYLKKYQVRFAGMARPGDVITITGAVKDKKKEGIHNLILCDVEARNQKNELLVTGSFEAELPNR
jgi:acyl dehydratase